MPDYETERVNARPVKEFFINIITRDVPVSDTILEFVDNSMDGAKRLRDDQDYEGLVVDIEIDPDQVEVKDNCGGIPKDHAQDYAFRFGRPTELEGRVDSIIGKFGVGMKRSLFKIGRSFMVESLTQENHFIIEVDVDEWMEKDTWDFEMELIPDDVDDDRCELTENGTRVVIEDILEQPKEEFQKDIFMRKLRNKLSSRNQTYLRDGLDITLNKDPVIRSDIEMYESEDLQSGFKSFEIPVDDGVVEVEVGAGLGERSNDEGGWYVFCNGRLVLEADQEGTTGWGEDPIPKFHGEFNRFRGFINFKSNDPGNLPWDTTKTDINEEDPVYRKAKQEMKQQMRPVIDVLYDIAEEKSETGGESKLEQSVEESDFVTTADIEADASEEGDGEREFTAPKPKETDTEREVNISYRRPIGKVEAAMDMLEVDSYSEVGRQTFDYYIEYEVDW